MKENFRSKRKLRIWTEAYTVFRVCRLKGEDGNETDLRSKNEAILDWIIVIKLKSWKNAKISTCVPKIQKSLLKNEDEIGAPRLSFCTSPQLNPIESVLSKSRSEIQCHPVHTEQLFSNKSHYAIVKNVLFFCLLRIDL